jgi:hypothetical protein
MRCSSMIISSHLTEVISNVERNRVKTGILIVLEDKRDQQERDQVGRNKGATKLSLFMESLSWNLESNCKSTIHNSDFFILIYSSMYGTRC